MGPRFFFTRRWTFRHPENWLSWSLPTPGSHSPVHNGLTPVDLRYRGGKSPALPVNSASQTLSFCQAGLPMHLLCGCNGNQQFDMLRFDHKVLPLHWIDQWSMTTPSKQKKELLSIFLPRGGGALTNPIQKFGFFWKLPSHFYQWI